MNWQRFSAFLGKADCLERPRDAGCLVAPLAQAFHGGVPVNIKLRDSNGKMLMDYAKGAFAETEEEMRRGLEGRSFLRPDEALLLHYQRDNSGHIGDIMQNTPQDLDIGWFDSNGKLLEVHPLRKNDPEVTWSKYTDIAYGLEVPRGSFAGHGAEPGAWLDLSQLRTSISA